ncbi:MAG: sugar transferase [Candidatus Magasanikiibacteriota bacterium]
MKRSEVILMVLQVPIDFVLLVLAGISAYYLRFSEWAIQLRPVIFRLTLNDFFEVAFLVSIIWIVIFAIFGLYSADQNRKLSRDLLRVLLASSVGLGIIALYVMFALQQFDSRFLVAGGFILAVIYVSLGRILMRGVKSLLYRMGIGLRRVVIIGTEEVTKSIVNTLQNRKELGYKVVKVLEKFNLSAQAGKNLIPKLDKLKLNEIIFTNPKADEKETLGALNYCNQRHIVFKYSADLFATYSANMSVTALAGVPIVELKRTTLDGWGRVIKRIFDIIMSVVVIIITSPIMLLTTFVILIETGRPIIYKNERVGIRGKNFFTLKFRSMFQKDSTGMQFGEVGLKNEQKEKELIKTNSIKSGPVYKIANDPRVTPFGRFIRRWSWDELPQFFNVLGGSMSIVGPRPHQPREVKQYEDEYSTVFTLKPGITGLAQISGRSDLSFDDEMKLDVFYIEKWSLFLDIIIFLKTPFVIFKKRKAL